KIAADSVKQKIDLGKFAIDQNADQRSGEYLGIAKSDRARADATAQADALAKSLQAADFDKLMSGISDPAVRTVAGLHQMGNPGIDVNDLRPSAPKPPQFTFREDAQGLMAIDPENPTNTQRVPGFRPVPKGEPSAPKEKYGTYMDETGKLVTASESDAAKRGLTPSRMQSDKERQNKGDLQTAVDLIDDITDLGTKSGWAGIGGLKSGSIQQWLAGNMGAGTPDEIRLRSKIGNLRGDVMHQRLGAALTKQELQTAESYLASIDQNPAMAEILLDEYRNFLKTTMKNRGFTAADKPDAQKRVRYDADGNPIKGGD
ncbi:hypothetical protein UFOVP509_1, partial [uncultured Caudovirales phage]